MSGYAGAIILTLAAFCSFALAQTDVSVRVAFNSTRNIKEVVYAGEERLTLTCYVEGSVNDTFRTTINFYNGSDVYTSATCLIQKDMNTGEMVGDVDYARLYTKGNLVSHLNLTDGDCVKAYREDRGMSVVIGASLELNALRPSCEYSAGGYRTPVNATFDLPPVHRIGRNLNITVNVGGGPTGNNVTDRHIQLNEEYEAICTSVGGYPPPKFEYNHTTYYWKAEWMQYERGKQYQLWNWESNSPLVDRRVIANTSKHTITDDYTDKLLTRKVWLSCRDTSHPHYWNQDALELTRRNEVKEIIVDVMYYTPDMSHRSGYREVEVDVGSTYPLACDAVIRPEEKFLTYYRNGEQISEANRTGKGPLTYHYINYTEGSDRAYDIFECVAYVITGRQQAHPHLSLTFTWNITWTNRIIYDDIPEPISVIVLVSSVIVALTLTLTIAGVLYMCFDTKDSLGRGECAKRSDEPAPREADKPAPREADKPAPREAKKPAPREAKKPAPRDADKPGPIQADKPGPIQADKPTLTLSSHGKEEKVMRAVYWVESTNTSKTTVQVGAGQAGEARNDQSVREGVGENKTGQGIDKEPAKEEVQAGETEPTKDMVQVDGTLQTKVGEQLDETEQFKEVVEAGGTEQVKEEVQAGETEPAKDMVQVDGTLQTKVGEQLDETEQFKEVVEAGGTEQVKEEVQAGETEPAKDMVQVDGTLQTKVGEQLDETEQFKEVVEAFGTEQVKEEVHVGDTDQVASESRTA